MPYFLRACNRKGNQLVEPLGLVGHVEIAPERLQPRGVRIIRRIGVLFGAAFGLRVAAAPRDVGLLLGQLVSIAASIAACAAALTIRTACLCIDPTLIFSGNQQAADVQIVQRVADVSQLERVQLPRVREGKRGLRRPDFFALQKGTSFIVSQTAHPAIFSGYSIP